jgi:adenine-specific DNA methylase
VYASDINPVASLVGRATLDQVQRHGDRLLAAVTEQGEAVGRRARVELGAFYPGSGGGRTPIAWLWFRRVRCDGPGCGADVPLTSKLELLRRGPHPIVLRVAGWDGPTPVFEVFEGSPSGLPPATIRRGAATCMRCGFTMPVQRVREQLTAVSGGTATALLCAVVEDGPSGRSFRAPNEDDWRAVESARVALEAAEAGSRGDLPLSPDEPLPPVGTLGFRVQRYGVLRWLDLYTPRQLLTLTTFARLVRGVLSADRAPVPRIRSPPASRSCPAPTPTGRHPGRPATPRRGFR